MFLLQVIELMGKENVKLSARQVDEIIDLISIEEQFENEDKLEKALSKNKKLSEELIDSAKSLNHYCSITNTSLINNQQNKETGFAVSIFIVQFYCCEIY